MTWLLRRYTLATIWRQGNSNCTPSRFTAVQCRRNHKVAALMSQPSSSELPVPRSQIRRCDDRRSFSMLRRHAVPSSSKRSRPTRPM